MSSDYDIEMSLNDTLELDAIIKSWNPKSNSVITEDQKAGSYDMNGFQTKTAVFDPDDSGVYQFDINGQKIKINVKDTSGKLTEIDFFEHGDISSYYSANTGSWSSDTNKPVYEGDKSSKGNGNNETIISLEGDGLPNYPSAGDSFEFRVNKVSTGDSSGNWTFGFGTQDTSTVIPNNTYYITTNHSWWRLGRKENGNPNQLDEKTSVSTPYGEWLKVRIDWGTNGTITVTVEDSNGNQLTQLSYSSDTTWSSGGILFSQNADDGSEVRFDQVGII